MAQRGRRPKPTAQKELEGTLRPDRVNHAEPRPPEGVAEAPAFLDAQARALWDQLVPVLTTMRVFSVADATAFATVCQQYSRWQTAEDAVKTLGLLIPSGNGSLKTNPAVGIAREAMAACLRGLVEFGCTPSSRSRVKALGGDEKKDELDAFLQP